jgi:hypothetical protein
VVVIAAPASKIIDNEHPWIQLTDDDGSLNGI